MEIKIRSVEYTLPSKTVFNVLYTINVTDREVTRSYHNRVQVTGDPNAVDFIAYEDLTEEVVAKWVRDELGFERLEAIEAKLMADIEEVINPTTEMGLPWVIQPSVEEPTTADANGE